jgi:hypothetical protein
MSRDVTTVVVDDGCWEKRMDVPGEPDDALICLLNQRSKEK